jgi:hypothetical protein
MSVAAAAEAVTGDPPSLEMSAVLDAQVTMKGVLSLQE